MVAVHTCAEDTAKLIVENLSLGDLEIPWLYQAMIRCRKVEFEFTNSFYKGTFDNNFLTKGSLSLPSLLPALFPSSLNFFSSVELS